VMHQPLLELTEKLGAHLPEGLDSVFYANSGSEAVEASVRLARMATGRPTIITVQGGFHGRTVGAASLTTAGTKFSAAFSPPLRLAWTGDSAVDLARAEVHYLLATRAHPRDVAAFLIEPVLGDGGYLATPPRYLQGLRERADAHGALLILDEVQAGVGRTG